MTLQDKYPTLEQSKRIAELLGENAPESDMWWHRWIGIKSVEHLTSSPDMYNGTRVRAYDLAEMGEMIRHVRQPDSCFAFPWLTDDAKSFGWYDNDDDWRDYPTEAKARAALLIYLLEQK